MAKTKAVLIVGGSGFVGTHLALKLRESYKVFATYYRHQVPIRGVTMLPMGLHNRDWAKRLVYLAQPEVVIYAAGNNDVAWNEEHGREAEYLHTDAPANICNVADILQPTFIFLSNSYVFDGGRGNYHEGDIALPTTILGKATLGGENVVRTRSLSYVLIRSAPLLGRSNGYSLSMMDKLRIYLERGHKIELPDDELQNFAPIEGLVDLVTRVIETGTKKKVFHYGGLTKTTPFDFAREFAERFKMDPRLVIAKKTPREGGHTGETLDYSLNFTQSVETLKVKPLFLEESLDLVQKKLVPRY